MQTNAKKRFPYVSWEQVMAFDPKMKGDHLAHQLGFYDRSSLWLFMKRKGLLRRNPRLEHANDVLYWMEKMGSDPETINEYKQKLWQNGITY